MAFTELDGGTDTADGSEQTLSTQTGGKTCLLVVETNNMANGDVLELRVYTKVRTGGTSRVAWSASYANVQADPNKYSIPVPANIEFKATLKQTAGTNRTYIWAVIGQ